MEHPDLQPTTLVSSVPALDFRQASVRFDEWELYRTGIRVVKQAFDRLIENPPQDVTFTQVARLLEVVNRIGRLSSELGFDTTEQRLPENTEFMLEVDSILTRVFAIEGRDGAPSPSASSDAETADVQSTPAS